MIQLHLQPGTESAVAMLALFLGAFCLLALIDWVIDAWRAWKLLQDRIDSAVLQIRDPKAHKLNIETDWRD